MAEACCFVADGDALQPEAPWILLEAETLAGDGGTGAAHGRLSDVRGPFGICAQTLLFDRRQ